ncbi:MAG: TlpA family protein disulfide reductase [Candidatus Eremiobacteraeota bacterium]|nr:TlpA family protein disulfide reductase [Candidatus Eremiobacteraeota bacterium]
MLRPATAAWALALIVLCAFGLLYFGSAGPQRGIGPGSLAGSPAQSFPLQSLSGTPASLRTFRGKIIVLNLWASWCPPCRAEMPDLQRLYRTYKNRGVVVLGVNQGESAQRAGSFARSLQIDFPVLLDQSQQYGRVYAALGLPSTFVIDRTGMVASGFDGALTFDQMTAAVRPLLGKK